MNSNAVTTSRLRLSWIFCLLLASPLAMADTFRFASGVIADGDSKAKVLRVAGEPESKKPAKAAGAKSPHGGKKGKGSAHAKSSGKHTGDEASGGGETWSYRYEGKLVDITLRDGIVTRIVTHRPR